MKEKIALALKTKYQRFGLSNEAIDRIASAKEKTVTSEDAIESGIADTETMGLIASELMKMRDKEIQQRTDTQRAFDTYKEKHPDGDPDPNPNPQPQPPKPQENQEPEWAKKLRERFEREDREKAEKTRRDALTARLKMEGCGNAGVLKFTIDGYQPVENESEDDAAARLKDAYNANYKSVFGEGPIPGFGGNGFGDPKTATEAKNDFLRKQGRLPQENK